MEGDGVKFTIFRDDGKDCHEGVVQGVSFDDNWLIQDPVSEYQGRGKCLLQYVEGFVGLFSELERNSFSSETSEGYDSVEVVENEVAVEIGEAKEGLDILYLPWLRPVLDNLNLCLVHGESLGG